MKSWKKRWNDELNEAVPKLKQEILDAPIIVSEELNTDAIPPVKRKKLASFAQRRAYWGMGFAAAAIALCLSLFFFLKPNAEQDKYAAFTIEVNPSVVFALGEDGLVSSVTALNADADVILENGERLNEMTGKTADAATRVFLDYAARLGFINFDTYSAVRVAALEGSGDVAVVGEAVKDYFMDKGGLVAVVEASASLSEVSDLIEIKIDEGIEGVVSSLEKLPVLFEERESFGKTQTELETLYIEKLKVGRTNEFIVNLLNSGRERIDKKTAALDELKAIYSEISESDETGLNDYWMIKNFDYTFGLDYSEEFGLLLEEMETKLNAYEAEYGEKITSALQLMEIGSLIAGTAIQSLYALVENFTVESLMANISEINGVFEFIGLEIEGMLAVPKSKEEYLKKTQSFLAMDFSSRVNEYFESYSTPRVSVTEDEYNSFIGGIIDEFGSLENYWQSLKR